jgi:hypothetical protein
MGGLDNPSLRRCGLTAAALPAEQTHQSTQRAALLIVLLSIAKLQPGIRHLLQKFAKRKLLLLCLRRCRDDEEH